MADCMNFPATVEEFMEQYKITDTEQVYTNGIELVPIFRMKQWFEHQTTTADVIPIVHSEWVLGGYDDMYYICKRCGHKQSEYYHKPTAKYCPNCGAKMDEHGEG